MFNERGPRNTGEQSKSPEQLNLERQMKKLARFYAHSKDENPNDRGDYKSYMNYVFYSGKKGYGEDELTPDEAREAQRVLIEDGDLKNKERNLLKNMQGPVDRYGGANAVFNGMADDKHQKRILGYMVRGEKGWELYNYTSGSDVDSFIKKYKTPIDFEKKREDFLWRIREGGNSEEKIREYEDAMEEFQQRVYGKRYEYYKAMKELHKEAEEKDTYRPNNRIGGMERIKSRFAEFFERDPVIKDTGLAMVNKGDLTKNPDRVNEDAAYYNPEIGMFGVFDGAGGERNAALASQLGRDTVAREVSERAPETTSELEQILIAANEAVSSGDGVSTVVIGRILEMRGRKTLIYASVGDSRIYLVRKGIKEAIQITRDEGEGKFLAHGLGYRFRIEQAGELPLKDGDKIVFCSDGVTGDYEPKVMRNDELARIVNGATDASTAAQELVSKEYKTDDKTAIVVEV